MNEKMMAFRKQVLSGEPPEICHDPPCHAWYHFWGRHRFALGPKYAGPVFGMKKDFALLK